MTCTEVEEREMAEAYLLGRLSEEDRDAFEAHYFECPRCYSEVQALRDVREALHAEQRPVFHRWVWTAAAAVLFIAASSAVIWLALSPTERARPSSPPVASAPPAQPNAEEISRLAAVTPPPYSPSRLRSSARREAFSSGMARYAAGDHAGAIPLLERALRAEPAAEDVRFYLGASRLLSGDTDDAISTLQPLADRAESPYAEESRFLIAKALLRANRMTEAMSALDRTIALRGDREQEATAILTRLRALTPPSRNR